MLHKCSQPLSTPPGHAFATLFGNICRRHLRYKNSQAKRCVRRIIQSAISHLNANMTCQWRPSVSQQHSIRNLLNACIVGIFWKANMTGSISCRKLKQKIQANLTKTKTMIQTECSATTPLCFVDTIVMLHRECNQSSRPPSYTANTRALNRSILLAMYNVCKAYSSDCFYDWCCLNFDDSTQSKDSISIWTNGVARVLIWPDPKLETSEPDADTQHPYTCHDICRPYAKHPHVTVNVGSCLQHVWTWRYASITKRVMLHVATVQHNLHQHLFWPQCSCRVSEPKSH